jgi:hypothetical protein
MLVIDVLLSYQLSAVSFIVDCDDLNACPVKLVAES